MPKKKEKHLLKIDSKTYAYLLKEVESHTLHKLTRIWINIRNSKS